MTEVRVGIIMGSDSDLPVMQEAAETEADDALARFDADFALMGMELARFIPAVIGAFGGEGE